MLSMYLAPDQLAFLRDHGYLAVPDVLTEADLAPVESEYAALLERAAQELHEAGRISSPFTGLGFEEQYFAVLAEYPGLYEYLSISLPLLNEGIDPDTYRCHAGPALFGLLRHPKILDLVESVIGGEILSNPIQQIRLKPPLAKVPTSVSGYSNIGRTTWHQDHGAAMDDARNTDMLTVWIAVTDAWEDMGCLVVAPKSHIAEELTMHCPGDLAGVAAENFIPAGIIDGRPTVKLPVSKGSVVLLSKWTEHAALDNVSDHLRWSFDLRYQPVGQPTGRPAFP
ncbi:MAG: phytanoyl-CoA dioxygenase, partial [Anaerolineae bacterium]|nr:phytanoyl-CoA dioxygenase [Anaerolineae bacterium]